MFRTGDLLRQMKKTDPNKDFIYAPALLREARTRANLSKRQAALRMGWGLHSGTTNWSKYEEGSVTKPSMNTLNRLAMAVGLESGEELLIHNTTPQPQAPQDPLHTAYLRGRADADQHSQVKWSKRYHAQMFDLAKEQYERGWDECYPAAYRQGEGDLLLALSRIITRCLTQDLDAKPEPSSRPDMFHTIQSLCALAGYPLPDGSQPDPAPDLQTQSAAARVQHQQSTAFKPFTSPDPLVPDTTLDQVYRDGVPPLTTKE